MILKVAEITVECGRADTITKEKLQVLSDMGVTRISINPQTFNEKVDGEYVGIGATVQYDGEHVSIIEISKLSPAEKAGLKVNDELFSR